jgi:uncharacterized protein (TIGR02677 family)
MARVSTIADFYRARYLYRLSRGGEAVEAALVAFIETLQRRAELQTVALEDITSRLLALRGFADAPTPDAAKVHETLRDLERVFEGLADNAQAFMASVVRSIDLQLADAEAVAVYKNRLIDYLDRFIGDLVRRADTIATQIRAIEPNLDPLLRLIAAREAIDAAPGEADDIAGAEARSLARWRERWAGLAGWFVRTAHEPSQADLLRARARAAIPQLMNAIHAVNERRSGRSDRSADYRVLAGWFAACAGDAEAHRLARAAFALNPARHFALVPDGSDSVTPSTPWAAAPALSIHPRLREYGVAVPRGTPPRVQDRSEARRLLAVELAEEARQVQAARQRLATGRPTRLSELGDLDAHAFGLFLSLLGEALAEQRGPDAAVERQTGDGLLRLRLEPLGPETHAEIRTPAGVFSGRDHVITVAPTTVTTAETRSEEAA